MRKKIQSAVTALTILPMLGAVVVSYLALQLSSPVPGTLRSFFILVGISVVFALLALFLGRATINRFFRSLTELREYADKVRDGRWAAPVAVTVDDEVGALSRALQQMAETLLQSNLSLERKVEERTRELAASEARLRQSNVFLDSIVENIPHMIFVKDARELRFLRFNRAGEELLGYPREHLLGKNDYDFFPKEEADFFVQKDREVIERGGAFTIDEEPIHTKNGIRLLRTKKLPVFDAKHNPLYLLGISEDITDQKRAQSDLLLKQRELAWANAEKEQLEIFAYVAGHDLQEPLHKIVSFGDLLNEQIAPDSPGREYLERMQNAARRMSRLIEDLLRFSRVTTKEEAAEPVNLKDVLDELVSDFDLRIKQSGGSIDVGALPVVSGSRVQFREVFQNLIGNALKFRKKDQPPKIVVESHESDAGHEIVVRDNGIGFEQKYAERIFRPFERLHNRREYDGTGIGLAICQKIIARYGGRISAASKPGEGSVFRIELPRAKTAPEYEHAQRNS